MENLDTAGCLAIQATWVCLGLADIQDQEFQVTQDLVEQEQAVTVDIQVIRGIMVYLDIPGKADLMVNLEHQVILDYLVTAVLVIPDTLDIAAQEFLDTLDIVVLMD